MKSKTPKSVNSSLLKKRREKELKIYSAKEIMKWLETQEKRKKNANVKLKLNMLTIKMRQSMELDKDGRME